MGVSAACYRQSEDIDVLAVVVPELKFRDIQRQVLLADLAIVPTIPRLRMLQKHSIVFVWTAPRTYSPLVCLDDLVRVQLLDVMVANPFFGNEQAHLTGRGVHHESGQYFAARASNDVALPVHSGHDGDFPRAEAATTRATAPVPTMLILGFAADERLIDFDNIAKLIEIVLDESSVDTVAHIPSGLIGTETEMAMNLPCAYTLLAGQQKVDDLKPTPEIDIGILENRSGNIGEPIAAGAAIRALPFEFHGLEFVGPVRTTARAVNAFGPSASYEIGVASILVRKHFLKLSHGQLGDLLRLFCTGHDGYPYRERIECHV